MTTPTDARLAESLRRFADIIKDWEAEMIELAGTLPDFRLAALRLSSREEISEAGIERGAIDLAGGQYSWDQLGETARENFRERFRAALEAAKAAREEMH
jgi:hypothetical protein